MSMVACPGCGQLVPAQKPACIACGRPLWRTVPGPYVRAAIDPMAEHRSTVQFAYVLLAASFLFGPVFVVAAVFAQVKRAAVRGTWLESHCAWLVDTALVAAAATAAGVLGFVASLLAFAPAGLMLLAVTGVAVAAWLAYRAVRGWMLLEAQRPATGILSPPRW